MGKKSRFVSTFRRICTIFTEHRRRLNNKKRKNFVFSFLLSSTCTIFAHMKLSVVIPVYRSADTLDRCVGSVVAQDVREMEVILVDDGSPDACPALCDDWAGRDRRVRVIHQLHEGLSAARNAGIDAAQGEFITFVDSDDTSAPHAYSPLLDTITQLPNCDMMEYPVYVHYGDKHRQHRLTFSPHQYDDWTDYWVNARGYAHAYAWNKIYRRSIFDGVRYPVGRTFEDVYTTPLLQQRCRSGATCNAGLYYYHANAQGITARASGEDLAMLLEAHNRLLPTVSSGDYYAHVLNIALDVYHFTRQVPTLVDLPYTHTLKLKLKRLLGLKRLCQLHHFARRFCSKR